MRASEIARRRTEPGWRAAVLDERASGQAFRLRAREEVGRIPSAMREQRTKGLSGGKAISQAVPCRFWSQTRESTAGAAFFCNRPERGGGKKLSRGGRVP